MRRDIIIKNSSGGMTNDPHERDVSKARILQHFNISTENKLIPHRSYESGDSSASTNKIANYQYHNGILYGLAQSSGTGPAAVLTNADLTGDTWTTTNGSSNIGGSNRADADIPFFVAYKKTGKLYGVRGGRYVWSIADSGGSAETSECDLTAYTTVTQGGVHSKDDCLYVPYDNKIARNNNGSWTAAALTLPSNLVITSITEQGNYWHIGCRTKTGLRSKSFLWDRDATLTTLSESIDWGEGDLTVLDEIGGVPVGISFLGTTGSYTNANAKMVIRSYQGGPGAAEEIELSGFSQSPAIQASFAKQKANDRIHFFANVAVGSTSYNGIWSVGCGPDGRFNVALERLMDNSYSFNGGITLYGFIILGDYTFISFLDNTTHKVNKTNDAAAYTATSLRESLINPGMPEADRDRRKQLVYGGLSFDPLPSGAQGVLKYRVDGGSWNTVLTETTDGKVVSEKIIAGLIGRNFEFRDESTGGAVITGLRYKYETLQSLI